MRVQVRLEASAVGGGSVTLVPSTTADGTTLPNHMEITQVVITTASTTEYGAVGDGTEFLLQLEIVT